MNSFTVNKRFQDLFTQNAVLYEIIFFPHFLQVTLIIASHSQVTVGAIADILNITMYSFFVHLESKTHIWWIGWYRVRWNYGDIGCVQGYSSYHRPNFSTQRSCCRHAYYSIGACLIMSIDHTLNATNLVIDTHVIHRAADEVINVQFQVIAYGSV